MRRILFWLSTAVLSLLALVVLLLLFPPERWIADQAERLVLEKSGYTLHIGSLDLDLIDWTPSATLADVELDGAELEDLTTLERAVAAVDLRALLKGELLIDRVTLDGADVALVRDADGRTTWAAAPTAPSEPAEPSDGPPPIPAIRELSIEGLTLHVDDAVTTREATLRVAATGSTLANAPPATLEVSGDIDGVATGATLEIAPLDGAPAIDSGLKLELAANVGEARATLAGQVENPRELAGVELETTFEAEDIAALAKLLRTELPPFRAISFAGTVLREGPGGEFELRRFDLATGDSRLQGDVRVDPSTEPVTLYANLISSRLDVDGLGEVLFGKVVEGDDEGAQDGSGESAAADAPDEGASDATPGGDVLVDEPLPLVKLFGYAQGAIRLTLQDIVAEGLPLDSLDARVELAPRRVVVSIVELAAADGTIGGTLTLARPDGESSDPEQTDESVDAVLELELAGLDLKRILRAAELPDDAGGRLGGKMKYWSKGASPAAFAAALDGGTFLLMEGGTLAAVFVELAGIDLFQSLGDVLVPGDDSIPIRCAYVDVQSKQGLTTIGSFVIDTTDTIFLADGTVNLADETLDIVLEPHPKDASLIASSTPVQLTGTFGAPEIKVGSSLPVRAAAVAILATIAAPAAALLPLIEIGGGEDSPYCSGLEGALDDANN